MSTSDVDKRLQSVAQRVATLDLLIDPTNHTSLITAKNTLNSIVSELVSISSIKDSGNLSSNERLVISEIDELLNHTLLLKQQIESTISENENLHETINNHSSTASTITPARDQVDQPLNQEEIRKLLLLVSKAQSLDILTDSQKGLIKDQICRRAPFMRLILVDDITIVLSSMKEIATTLEENFRTR